MEMAHGHSTRPRCTRLDLTAPIALSQGPPDGVQSSLGGCVVVKKCVVATPRS